MPFNMRLTWKKVSHLKAAQLSKLIFLSVPSVCYCRMSLQCTLDYRKLCLRRANYHVFCRILIVDVLIVQATLCLCIGA
uniref:Uncharacterized protein n=1 Tax=Alectorobius mimon TaxID=360319 RepID=A0A147B7S4_9ACAR